MKIKWAQINLSWCRHLKMQWKLKRKSFSSSNIWNQINFTLNTAQRWVKIFISGPYERLLLSRLPLTSNSEGRAISRVCGGTGATAILPIKKSQNFCRWESHCLKECGQLGTPLDVHWKIVPCYLYIVTPEINQRNSF